MNFKSYLEKQLNMHKMTAQDVIKMCYQASFGAEHLIEDINLAQNHFDEEYEKTEEADIPLYEEISEDFCRVNIASWKKKNLCKDWLFKMFTGSCKKHEKSEEKLKEYLEVSKKLLPDFKEYIDCYVNEGIRAVHHSESYRESEKPAYRVIDKRYLKLLPVLFAVKEESEKPFCIAIDGRAASGKTTLAAELSKILDADVLHMDDFFLPINMRTEKRLSGAGGNIHYERFEKEVLPHLLQNKEFSYKIFDCEKQNYNGERKIGNKSIRIVEGSYSHHPLFGDYASLKVFLTVSKKEQINRIVKRNGEKMAEVFLKKWIPLEEEYFTYYKILEKSNITLGL